MLIRTRSHARAGFLGNPSDGYFGKTVSFAFRDFSAEVTLYETPELGFVPGDVDDSTFDSPDDLLKDIQLFGYYGGIRLLKAVTKLFFLYCRDHGVELPQKNFTVRYTSNIPRLVGLSGSSAICTAMLKALQQFYGVEMPLEYAPTLCLEAERDELGIQCGLQDRVIQMYGGCVFMDFEKSLVEETGHPQEAEGPLRGEEARHRGRDVRVRGHRPAGARRARRRAEGGAARARQRELRPARPDLQRRRRQPPHGDDRAGHWRVRKIRRFRRRHRGHVRGRGAVRAARGGPRRDRLHDAPSRRGMIVV